MYAWGFSLERLMATCDLLHKSDLQNYNVGMFIIDTSCEAHLVFLGIWLMVFMVHGRDCICVVVDVLRDWISEMGWWLRSCKGYYTYLWLHTPMWHMTRERHIFLE